ncbi:MAG: TolC family outer membrane protein [Chlorobium sp.]
MKLFANIFLLAGLLVALPVHAEQVDLTSAYQMALEYDARFRSAKADNRVYKEEVGKARSQFLPNVRMSAARGRSATQHGYLGRFYPVDFYNTVNTGLSVRQPLFNLSTLASYKQAKLVSSKSEVDFRKEGSNLILRITEAYCNALFAEDNLEFSKSLVKATEEQLGQAKRRYKNGFGTRTDVEEAQAGYDNARADGVEILNSVEYSRRELEDMTGVFPDKLCKIVAEKLPLSTPDPGRVESWIEMSHSGNLAIEAARQEVQIAKREEQKQRAARYPTIDIVGGRNYSESENNYSIGSIYDTYSISVQMSMPVYTGGYIRASVRQAHAKWIKAGEQLSWQERGVESEVRKYFNGVVSNISLIKAYEQAVNSREIALTGTKKGYEAGLRSNVEVLDAQQKLYASRRNLSKSRYQYILNRLMLRQTTGALSVADIEEVNSWLVGAEN